MRWTPWDRVFEGAQNACAMYWTLGVTLAAVLFAV